MKKKIRKSLDVKKVSIYNLSSVTGGEQTGYACMDASTPTSCYAVTKAVTTNNNNALAEN